ncbi:hypothetical protein MACJ_000636 [Theileria orientalis]|uniref:Nuclear protein Es2 n=1 Tax=Theileria orientalis TaxID=68886 RepID=A0A976QRV2_THEOR|nr:hypothetical protein MACJ_000636 [Theileria orientalis]
MDETKPKSLEGTTVNKVRRPSIFSNNETPGHSSPLTNSNSTPLNVKGNDSSISKINNVSLSKLGDQSIARRNRSLGALNGVSTEVKLPVVPYSSTLTRLEKRKLVKELNEDDYVACMENIIERDYFPDLLKYRYLKAISEAEKSGNNKLAGMLDRELDMIKSGEINNDVYLRTIADENVVVNLGKDGLKLDEFNRIFSSEDNRSFDKLMEKDIHEKNERTKWMEDAEYKHNLALADVQKKTNVGEKSTALQLNKFEARNLLFFSPDPKIVRPEGGLILARNTNLSLGDKELDQMAAMQTNRRNKIIKRKKDEEISDLIVAQGVSRNKELLEMSGNMSSYVFTPKIISGEAEPIFTWGTIGSVESIPATPVPTERDPVKKVIMEDESLRDGKEFDMPRPLVREEIANKLYRKLKAPKTPIRPDTPFTPKTPLIVQKLIAKHSKGVDTQLRDSYSLRKYRSSRASSLSSRK